MPLYCYRLCLSPQWGMPWKKVALPTLLCTFRLKHVTQHIGDQTQLNNNCARWHKPFIHNNQLSLSNFVGWREIAARSHFKAILNPFLSGWKVKLILHIVKVPVVNSSFGNREKADMDIFRHRAAYMQAFLFSENNFIFLLAESLEYFLCYRHITAVW